MTPDEYDFWKRLNQTQQYFKLIEEEVKKAERCILDSGNQADIGKINYLIGYRVGLQICLNYEPQKEENQDHGDISS